MEWLVGSKPWIWGRSRQKAPKHLQNVASQNFEGRYHWDVLVDTIEMSWETTDVLSADTTDILSADTTDVLSADTTDVWSAGTSDG